MAITKICRCSRTPMIVTGVGPIIEFVVRSSIRITGGIISVHDEKKCRRPRPRADVGRISLDFPSHYGDLGLFDNPVGIILGIGAESPEHFITGAIYFRVYSVSGQVLQVHAVRGVSGRNPGSAAD